MDKTIISGILLAVLVVTASGCLIVSGRSVQESGVRISEATMEQVEIGDTTEAWIVAALGEPTSRTELDDSRVLTRYEHWVTRSEGGAVFLIFAGGSETTRRSTTYFEFENGVLCRTWSEATTD